MTAVNQWHQQTGGLHLAVSPLDITNLEHREAALNIVRTVAQTHGAEFQKKSFQNNMDAIYSGDLVVDLYLAKWDICERKPLCLGGALGWETFGFTVDGEVARSFYTEDVCILKSQLRPLLLTKPKGKKPPEESLAACFERINLQQMASKGMMFRFGEVDRDNTTMMRQLLKNEADMGIGVNSAVLEYKELPNTLLDSFPMTVRVRAIEWNGVESKSNFIGRWKDNSHDQRFIFTVGQATASGQRRVDIKSWHNGQELDPAIRNCVINSSLLEIKRLMESPEMSAALGKAMPSPSIPLLATRREQFDALYAACGDEIIFNFRDRPNSFGTKMPHTHIFVQGDAEILGCFLANGAEHRRFGNKPMIPGVNLLRSNDGLVT